MGEVYRARDTRLGRDVALKVLPEAFAADTERLARFEREAKVLASLNHCNVASIYGLEESNHRRALVMELVEGQTLADRIAGGAIPVDEALLIARQLCEGLGYAHERGIVHRDLKPANVKLTPEGQVKILDFGLAKALDLADTVSVDRADSPTTITRMATRKPLRCARCSGQIPPGSLNTSEWAETSSFSPDGSGFWCIALSPRQRETPRTGCCRCGPPPNQNDIP